VEKVCLFNGLAAIASHFSAWQGGEGRGPPGGAYVVYIHSYTHGVFRTYVHFYTVNNHTYTRNAQRVVRDTAR